MKNLKFQKLNPKAILPSRASENSCGLDIYSAEEILIKKGNRYGVHTGLAIAIPRNHYGRVAPRSGLALRKGIDVLAGVIDSDYRGELICLLINLGEEDFKINIGDRIAQLIVEQVAILSPEWAESLDATERNEGGFGSTGV